MANPTTWTGDAEMEAQEARAVLSSIGKVKPLFDETWVAPRTKGMIQMSCLCEKRGMMATIMLPSPRLTWQDLVIWSLEGPRRHDIVNTKRMKEKDSDGNMAGVMCFEALDAILVVQMPALLHMLDQRHLLSYVETPHVLHERQMVCMTQSRTKGEIIVSFIDGKVAIFTLTRHKITKKADGDDASCVMREYDDYLVKERLSWNLGGGLNFVRDFTVDEGWHNEGVCVLGIVDMNVIAWKWDTGAPMFKISGSHLNLKQRVSVIEMRDDLPQIVAGFKDGKMLNWSIRPGSRGKVVETLDGHFDCAIQGLKIDHKSGVLYSIDEKAHLKCWHLENGLLMNSENLTDECVDDEELFKSNPWSYHECNPAPCNLEIAFIDGAVLLMCYTPKHNVKVLQGQTHRRFFTKAAYPYTWIRPVSSRHLMSSIRLEKYKAEPPPRTGLKLAERGAGDDEIILAVCSEGSLYMYEARTCEVLGLVVLARRHELFVSGKGADQAKVEHNKIHEKQKGDHSGASDGGGDGKKEGKKPKKQNKDEKGTKDLVAANREARKVEAQRLVDAFRLKSNNLSDKQVAYLHDKNEAARKIVEEQLGKIGKRRPDKVLTANSRSLGQVKVADLNGKIGKPFGCPEGLLVLLWEAGVVDIMRLDTQECIQSYIEVVRDHGSSTCFAFFADPGDDEGIGGHTLVTGHGKGHIKIWTKTNEFPSSLILTLRVGEDHEGDVVSIVPAGGTVRPGYPQGAPTYAFVGCQRGPIGVYENGTWRLKARVCVRANLKMHECLTSMVMYTPSLLMLCYRDGVMRIWRFKPYSQKQTGASKAWTIAKTLVTGAVGVQAVIKKKKDTAGKLVDDIPEEHAGDAKTDVELETETAEIEEDDPNETRPKGLKKFLRSRSVQLLHQAPKSAQGLHPLWPSGRKEEGDVDGMFAMQYGSTMIVDVMPEFRKFITKSDLMNFVEWGITEDEHGRVIIEMKDFLSRDAEIVVRKAGRGELVHAQCAAYLHPGSALIAFAIDDEINLICGGFKLFGSRYANKGLEAAVNARVGKAPEIESRSGKGTVARTGSDGEFGRTGSGEMTMSRTGSNEEDSASEGGKAQGGRRRFVSKRAPKMKRPTLDDDDEEAQKIGRMRRDVIRRRKAAVMQDRFETDLHTPRADFFPDPEPIWTEAERALLNLQKILGPRMDQIGSLNNLEVPPTPYTLKFSAIEGLEPLPDLPASFMARNAPDIKQQLPLHPYIRRPYAIPEPELSPRTLMRQRLKETVRMNRKLASEAGPHLARQMWQSIDMENAVASKNASSQPLSEAGGFSGRSSAVLGSLGSTWGGVACKEAADTTIQVADAMRSVDTLFNMTPKNLLQLPVRPQTAGARTGLSAAGSLSLGSHSLSLSLSHLSLSSAASSVPPLRGAHPDPRPGFSAGETVLLGSWNRHIVSGELGVTGAKEPINTHPHDVAGMVSSSLQSSRVPPPTHTRGSRPSSGTTKRVPISLRPPTHGVNRRGSGQSVPDPDVTHLSNVRVDQLLENVATSELQILRTSSHAMRDPPPDLRASKPAHKPKTQTMKAQSRPPSAQVGRPPSALAGRQSKACSAASSVSASRLSSAASSLALSLAMDQATLYPPTGIDSRERVLLKALISFKQQHIRALDKLLARTRGQTPEPSKSGSPMWEERGGPKEEKRRFLRSIAPGIVTIGGKLYSAEAP